MRGQVITASLDDIVICVGLDDEAQLGQQLTEASIRGRRIGLLLFYWASNAAISQGEESYFLATNR